MLDKTLLTDIGIEPSDADIILEADSRLGDKIQQITDKYIEGLNREPFTHYTAESNLASYQKATAYGSEIVALDKDNEYLARLLGWLHLMPYLEELYRKLGFSYSLFCDTARDIVFKINECKATYGKLGVFVDWFFIFIELRLFAMGRLQFELTSSPMEDYTYGGYTLKKGDPVFSCHIPTGAPLTTEVCYDALEKAYAFFKPHLKDGILPVICLSWLLYSEYPKKIYSEGSNLMKFSRLFDIVTDTKTDVFHDAWRVFGRELGESTEGLPANTSMQRAFISYINDGGTFGYGHGILLYDGEKKKIINV